MRGLPYCSKPVAPLISVVVMRQQQFTFQLFLLVGGLRQLVSSLLGSCESFRWDVDRRVSVKMNELVQSFNTATVRQINDDNPQAQTESGENRLYDVRDTSTPASAEQ